MNAFESVANNQGYNTGMPGFTPFGYAQPTQPQKAQMTNPLTDEERKLLQNNIDAFDLKIKPEELASAVCTHKDNGKFATVVNPDGSVTCTICHKTFRPNDVDEEFVKKAVDAIINTLQTCKMIGVDLNNEVIRQFFAIIPYIERVPKLYKMVNAIFNRYGNTQQVQPVNYGQSVQNMYNYLTNPAVPVGGMMPGYGQPAYYQQPPMGYQQPPVQNPFTNMQNAMVNGGVNPFYQQPPMGYQQPPMAGAPVPPQQMPPQQEQPQQNPNGQENVTVTKQMQL